MTPTKFKTITNKFESVCKRCGETVPAGTKVRWAKNRGIWHFANECERIMEDELEAF